MSKPFSGFEVIEEKHRLEEGEKRFTSARYLTVRNLYKDGSKSREYRLDVISHRGTDAVCVLPYWKEAGQYKCMLIESFRPALYFRDVSPENPPFILEAVAGVVEEGEDSSEGVLNRAIEELVEEAGLVAETSDVQILGAPIYMSPGVYTEKIWLTAVEVDPTQKVAPTHDGSVQEEMLTQHVYGMVEALGLVEEGIIKDAKTEIALRRLSDKLA